MQICLVNEKLCRLIYFHLFIYFQFQASNHGTVYEYAFRRRPAQQKVILKEQSETECKFAR